MNEEKDNTFDLEQFFKASRQDTPEPSADLMNRMMADIDHIADQREIRPAPQAGPSLWARILDGIGGWPTLSGMATAGVVGIVFGISPPDAVSDFTSTVLTGTSDFYLVDPYDGFGFDSFEG